ncbi:putative secreted protein [Granulibacter bethesdensis]|uniref:Secreted protein n=2 Tax=Granulibacter bethesdensis TaxID=364410 RepID=A0AAC9KBJ3_9PROT|nr:putative secreted protein [Granulibacter bethesdensis]APH61331.1 putative secreted protein [Granulibacter bethesdensis]
MGGPLMSIKFSTWLKVSTVIAVGAGFTATPAFADDYTDLLNILRAKGSLTQNEYSALMAKHGTGSRAARGRTARAAQTDAGADAQAAAASAAASAAAAQAAAQSAQSSLQASNIIRSKPYVPGKGITIRAGDIDLNFSGFVNGYYTYSAGAVGSGVVGGGLAQPNRDNSAIRGGLLPAALIFKASTTQAGIDMSAVFGIYPGINSSNTGTQFGANGGGSAYGLSTSGIDFRQVYVTAGTKKFGTVKVGRDLGIFGSDAILSDATLLGVGASGGNAMPGNTALGRIGIGYVYADWLPQISYASPTFGGVQITVGAMSPYSVTNAFSGQPGVTGSSSDTLMFQGKVTYDYAFGPVTGRMWSSFLVQPQQKLQGIVGANTRDSVLSAAIDGGIKANYGPFGMVGYYYRGSGLGTTGIFFDAIAANGRKRDSEGYYVQGTYNVTKKLKLVASYGQSNLNQAPGEINPDLIRTNEAAMGGVYYSLTDWMTLVGEYAYVQSKSHGDTALHSNNFTAGTMLFF